jgi:alanyl-tRNA synthetase
MQFDRAADGTLTPLPKPSVDTGMGLERLAAVMQGVHNNYDIDLFREPDRRCRGCRHARISNPSLRVIADHIRACAFLIVDGVLPVERGRGYVLRRIIRRAMRHGHKLGIAAVLPQLVAAAEQQMGAAYPELRRAAAACRARAEAPKKSASPRRWPRA